LWWEGLGNGWCKTAAPQTRVSQAKLDYHIKQLRKYFSRADDHSFLQMIWAVDALQSDREAAAKKLMPSYPKEAAVKSSLHSPYGIHRWELETLLIQLLLTPKEEKRAEGNLVLDCSKFDAIRNTINRLRGLENVESGRYLDNGLNIFGEMHRIAQRQFHWQHGYLNPRPTSTATFIFTGKGSAPSSSKTPTKYRLTTSLTQASPCTTLPCVHRGFARILRQPRSA
jgi:hypothetical protein